MCNFLIQIFSPSNETSSAVYTQRNQCIFISLLFHKLTDLHIYQVIDFSSFHPYCIPSTEFFSFSFLGHDGSIFYEMNSCLNLFRPLDAEYLTHSMIPCHYSSSVTPFSHNSYLLTHHPHFENLQSDRIHPSTNTKIHNQSAIFARPVPSCFPGQLPFHLFIASLASALFPKNTGIYIYCHLHIVICAESLQVLLYYAQNLQTLSRFFINASAFATFLPLFWHSLPSCDNSPRLRKNMQPSDYFWLLLTTDQDPVDLFSPV